MLDTPRIIQTTEQLIASIPLVVPRNEIQIVMGPAVREVYSALGTQGIAPIGPWFTHHRRRPTDTFDFEVCVPVDEKLAASGRVVPGKIPAARVARVVYIGPYEGLAAAWGEFLLWVEANRHKPATNLWEQYVVGPESGPDPANWRTELNQPLIGS
ncbi:MAG TPA: GyrI-like domain-containing protein [Gemmata sp.]|jgi:effector-binding domain-containing protein|nr:GyrI-like domain-containing protein [Gemmata sp.]